MTARTSTTSTPSSLLVELLALRGWTQTELARRLGLSVTYINDLAQGKRGFTARVALRLEAVFGEPIALVWMDMQRDHELAALRTKMAAELDEIRERGR